VQVRPHASTPWRYAPRQMLTVVLHDGHPIYTIKVRPQANLALCTCCDNYDKNMMMMRPQFSRLGYVSPYGLSLVLLCCREPAFSNYQIVHGLSPALPLSLTLTPLSVGTWGTRLPWVLALTRIRHGGSRDTIQWLRTRLVLGLRRSRDVSQSINL